MSTTFAVILKNGEQHDIARRVGRGILGCELSFTNELTELMSDETPVIPTDNSAQGIYTIGDIREHIRKQEDAVWDEENWIEDKSKIEQYQRKSVFAPMIDAWHKEHDFIEVTEWKNGEGWDIEVSTERDSQHISLHFKEFAVMKELIALLENN